MRDYLIIRIAFLRTGGPRYMREIRTKKLGSHITKRPRMPIILGIGSLKKYFWY
jgi:hypothetical protein